MEKRTKESRKRINSLILLIAFTAIMLIVSTYAWFTSQKDITLSNLRGTVEVAENMEISLDAKNWSQEIDLTDAADKFETAQLSRLGGLKETGSDPDDTDITAAAAVLPDQLLPVSGTGNDSGITAEKFLPLYTGEATSTTLTGIARAAENAEATEGFFAFDIYIKNTSRDGADDVLQLNLNSAVQVLTEDITKETTNAEGNTITKTYKGNADSGLQNTVRVALALYNNEVPSTSEQKYTLTQTKAATIKDVAIWEPNSTDHVEVIVNNNNKLVNGIEEHTTFADGDVVDTYALNSTAAGGEIENVYNVGDSKLTLQKTFKTVNQKEDGEIVDYRIDASANGNLPLDIQNVKEQNFMITSNTISKLRVYVWLEGQDVDCINQASLGGGIEVDLGLTKDNFIGDVLATP